MIYFLDFLIGENQQDPLLLPEESSQLIQKSASQEYFDKLPQNFVSKLFGGLLKQEIICKQCSHSSTIYEPFNVLSLPIEFDKDKAQYAKIKIIYIYDVDKYKKYEF